MPCKNGTRENIEQSKRRYAEERELDKTCPYRALWRNLVDRVYEDSQGFGSLSEDEKVYFAVGVLLGEVYNGGFMQFFVNTSGEHYRHAELGLVQMGATQSLELLRRAKNVLFGSATVPRDQEERWAAMREGCDNQLDDLDTEFYKDPDGMDARTETFAVSKGLVASP